MMGRVNAVEEERVDEAIRHAGVRRRARSDCSETNGPPAHGRSSFGRARTASAWDADGARWHTSWRNAARKLVETGAPQLRPSRRHFGRHCCLIN